MNEKKKITSIIGGDKIVLVVAIIAVFALFTSLNKNFMTTQNMINLLVASSLVGMVAIGHTYLIIAKQETVMEALCCLRNFFAGCIWNRVIQNWFGWNYYKLGSRYMFLAGFWFLPALFFASVLFFPIADLTAGTGKKTGIAAFLLFGLTAVLRAFKADLPYNLQIVPFWAAFLPSLRFRFGHYDPHNSLTGNQKSV